MAYSVGESVDNSPMHCNKSNPRKCTASASFAVIKQVIEEQNATTWAKLSSDYNAVI